MIGLLTQIKVDGAFSQIPADIVLPPALRFSVYMMGGVDPALAAAMSSCARIGAICMKFFSFSKALYSTKVYCYEIFRQYRLYRGCRMALLFSESPE